MKVPDFLSMEQTIYTGAMNDVQNLFSNAKRNFEQLNNTICDSVMGGMTRVSTEVAAIATAKAEALARAAAAQAEEIAKAAAAQAEEIAKAAAAQVTAAASTVTNTATSTVTAAASSAGKKVKNWFR